MDHTAGSLLEALTPESAVEFSDEWLLRCFVLRRDADAFTALVTRHGPMVLRVCRRVAVDTLDAEDAFQATFLVLARRAASVRDVGKLDGWLYRVAFRIALQARFKARNRSDRERRDAYMDTVAPDLDQASDELRGLIYDEVGRLPERSRQAVVLCYLNGRTNEEAAAELGLPVGTVKTRLHRARARLRSRLTRRGLCPSAARARSAE